MTCPHPLTRSRALLLARTLGHDPASWSLLAESLYHAPCQREGCTARLVELAGLIHDSPMLHQACPVRSVIGQQRRWRAIGRD